MNILSNGRHCFNAIPNYISTISFSVCGVMWLRTLSPFLVSSSGSLNYYNTLCSYVNCKPFKSNISRNLSTKMSQFETKESNQSSLIRLGDYECIGFDLDNTLCEYNIFSSVQMEYNVLAKFLVNEKGYDPILLNPLDTHSIDFLQKGLIIDFAGGNILKISDNGIILKASHGTKPLTEEEIVTIYGTDKKWHVTSEFIKNLLVAWDGPLSEQMRALLDYFDMPASLAFARIVDSLDNKIGETVDMSNVWVDVKDGLVNMYKREHFVDGKGDYFQEIKDNPHNYIKKCDPQVVELLKKIKESKLTFLITGSNCDFASLTAETCLGKNWRSLFDIIVCYARKPGFFTGCRPFVKLENFKETDIVDGNDLQLGEMYSQGNWQELFQLFARNVNKKQPRCLYFGDNLIQDIYTPSEYTKCDTIAVVEELTVESKDISHGYTKTDNSEKILESRFWGSYFYDNKEQLNTIWGSVIKNNAKVCVPSLSVLAQYSSLNNEWSTLLKDGNRS